ncbi:MAG TPA: DUF4369 domain-containing protein, partial [Ferruginibacter sp.]|nr:DUF4369 domain-containing protein [Ferruginibacter sp.]
MMKRIFLLFFLFAAGSALPAITFAQGATKTKVQPKTTATAKTSEILAPAADNFVIDGTVTGFPDGTTVELLNGQTGATEIASVVTGGKFNFKGKMGVPDFKIVLFNKQPPYITVFLDNSVVNITGDKAAIEKSKITGSPSHTAFEQFN